MAEKAELIQYSGMGLARRMLTVLAAMSTERLRTSDEADEGAMAQGLRLTRNKMWHELQADGVTAIEAKGQKFDPAKMEAITTIPASEAFAGRPRGGCSRSRLHVQTKGSDRDPGGCSLRRLTAQTFL